MRVTELYAIFAGISAHHLTLVIMDALSKVVSDAQTILRNAIDHYQPKYIVTLFSGGHDSLVATHLAKTACRVDFACHIETGFGIPDTRRFVVDTCERLAIPLKCYAAAKYQAPDGTLRPQLYRDLVLDHGFPGPAMHTKMYNRLKERPLRHMIRDLDRSRSDRVLLVSGLRASESVRRSRRATPVQVWEGTKVWVGPLWGFTKADVNRYMEAHGLARNPVVDALHKSGECLCGAFARPEEKEEIRFWYPEVARRIDRLEEEVRARGFDWGWGQKPKGSNRIQLRSTESTLCASCSLSEEH